MAAGACHAQLAPTITSQAPRGNGPVPSEDGDQDVGQPGQQHGPREANERERPRTDRVADHGRDDEQHQVSGRPRAPDDAAVPRGLAVDACNCLAGDDHDGRDRQSGTAPTPYGTRSGKSASSPQAEDHPISGRTQTCPPGTRTRDRANRDLQSICPGGAGFRTHRFPDYLRQTEQAGRHQIPGSPASRQWLNMRDSALLVPLPPRALVRERRQRQVQ